MEVIIKVKINMNLMSLFHPDCNYMIETLILSIVKLNRKDKV